MAHETDALETALGALRYRDLSADELKKRLASRGFDEVEREAALSTLTRTGLLDESRFAEGRARSLAERGAGDALIREKLARAGVASDLVSDVLAKVEPETERARRIVEARGLGPRTARYLAAKGFSAETVSAVVASGDDDALG